MSAELSDSVPLGLEPAVLPRPYVARNQELRSEADRNSCPRKPHQTIDEAATRIVDDWSLTSAKGYLHTASILSVASYGLCRRRSGLALGQLFRQILAGLETCISLCSDGDGFPGARVATLALLPLSHYEAAKSAQVYPFA